MLEVKRLRKRFGELVAVDDVSFRIDPGETLGLLGPNGAGKTTTLSMISGIVPPDSGEVLVEGRPIRGDVDPLKAALGVVPQDLALYDDLTAQQNMEFFGSLYGLSRAELKSRIGDALGLVGLADRARDKVKTYSGGMKRRLNLAGSLLHRPQILLLDEPTVGIDPQSRNGIFENLKALKDQGISLIYTTHYMEEAERLCDRIVIMDHGKVVAEGTPASLSRLLPGSNRLLIELDDLEDGGDDGWIERIRAEPLVRRAVMEKRILQVDLDDLSRGSARVLSVLENSGRSAIHIESERADLETVFLTLTGRSLRDS